MLMLKNNIKDAWRYYFIQNSFNSKECINITQKNFIYIVNWSMVISKK